MCQTEILPINESISNRATTLIEQYSLSHGLLLADALIDATAQEHGLTLFTANVKHFGAIENLAVEDLCLKRRFGCRAGRGQVSCYLLAS